MSATTRHHLAKPATRRRGQRKGDLTEQAILDTTVRLLAERPLAALTIDELARGAGISRSSFYFYFESRDAVLRALAERMTAQMLETSRSWVRVSGEAPAAAINRGVRLNLERWREHSPVLRALAHARESDPKMRELSLRLRDDFAAVVAGWIEHERAAGLAPAGPPEALPLAHLLIGMNERAFHDASLGPRSRRADDQLVETISAIWLRSVYLLDDPAI